MTNEEALKLIINAYELKFNEVPDENTKMLMSLSIPRIIDGEKFVWEDNNGWRVIRFIKD